MTGERAKALLETARANLDTALDALRRGERLHMERDADRALDALEYLRAERAAFHRTLEAISGGTAATTPNPTQP